MTKHTTLLLALLLCASTAIAQETGNLRPTPVNANRPAQNEVDVLFIGTDCGIGNFAAKEACRQVWSEHFGKLKTLRLHISGDNWTSPRADLAKCRARIVVLMLGGRPVVIEHKDPLTVAKGIATTLTLVRETQPQARVVLCGIPLPPTEYFLQLPVGPNKESAKNQVARSNALVARLADGEQVRFIDPVRKMEPRLEEISLEFKTHPDIHDVTVVWKAIAESMDEAITPLLKRE